MTGPSLTDPKSWAAVRLCLARRPRPRRRRTTGTSTLQAHTLAENGRVSTTYTRADLGTNAVTVSNTPDGRWIARLYESPDEHTSVAFDLESAADRAATEHSLAF